MYCNEIVIQVNERLFSRSDFFGELSEWFKEHAWKVCMPQKGIESSNLSLSANRYFFIYLLIAAHWINHSMGCFI